MSYAVASLQPIRDEIASEVAKINDEIDSEVVINAGWVDVTGQREAYAEYENTTGRTYEIMMRVENDQDPTVRLRNPDGAMTDLNVVDKMDLCFQLKPGESVEMLHNQYGDHIYWFERQL